MQLAATSDCEQYLIQIEQELERQYYSLGKYGVKIDTETTPLERNRVKVSINIAEGEDAEVYVIKPELKTNPIERQEDQLTNNGLINKVMKYIYKC